jgi:hypothetical protein
MCLQRLAAANQRAAIRERERERERNKKTRGEKYFVVVVVHDFLRLASAQDIY